MTAATFGPIFALLFSLGLLYLVLRDFGRCYPPPSPLWKVLIFGVAAVFGVMGVVIGLLSDPPYRWYLPSIMGSLLASIGIVVGARRWDESVRWQRHLRRRAEYNAWLREQYDEEIED